MVQLASIIWPESYKIKMLVGLNNPEPKYKNTRHNIGYEVIKEIEKYVIKLVYPKYYTAMSDMPWLTQFDANVSPIQWDAQKLGFVFVQSISGMNSSGIPVSALATYYGIKPEDVIVFHDDIDLNPGRIKVKTDGSSGGHNGLKSIDQYLGSNYQRVRIGVGKPDKSIPILDYVLGDFTESDYIWITAKKTAIAANFNLLIEGAVEQFIKNCNP